MEYCTSCKQPVTGMQESHEKTFTDNADGQTHTVQCSKCSYVFEAQSAHRWPTDEELAQQATCTEPVTLTLECTEGDFATAVKETADKLTAYVQGNQ